MPPYQKRLNYLSTRLGLSAEQCIRLFGVSSIHVLGALVLPGIATHCCCLYPEMRLLSSTIFLCCGALGWCFATAVFVQNSTHGSPSSPEEGCPPREVISLVVKTCVGPSFSSVRNDNIYFQFGREGLSYASGRDPPLYITWS